MLRFTGRRGKLRELHAFQPLATLETGPTSLVSSQHPCLYRLEIVSSGKSRQYDYALKD